MALLTMPRTRHGRHAARTPLWRQIGIGRARHDLTSQPLVSPPLPEPAVVKAPALPPVVSAEQARKVVGRLFPPGSDGLYALDWQYGTGYATAKVDPGLVVDAARNVVLSYAAAHGTGFVQETFEDRLYLRASHAVGGVDVTVWADITPAPQEQLALPAAEPPADPELPIERDVRCVLDETQTFPAITDDMDDPRISPDGDPVQEPTDPDHVAPSDEVDTADEPDEEQTDDDEHGPDQHDKADPADDSDDEEAAA